MQLLYVIQPHFANATSEKATPYPEGIQHQRSIEPRTLLLGSQDLSPYIKGAKVVSLKLYSLDVPTRK